MVKTTHSISLLNLHKGYPSAESVSQIETYSCAPQKNVWWNWDTNMKTASLPLWNQSRFRETAGVVKKQTCPRLAPGGVWPPKSDTLPSSAFLLIRNSGASPTPSPLPLWLQSSFFLTPSSFFPFLLPCLSSLFFSCYSFLVHLLFILSISPSVCFVPLQICFENTPHYPSDSSSTHSLWAAGRQQGMRGLGRLFLSFNSCCELWLSTSP